MIEKYALTFTTKYILQPASSIAIKVISNKPNHYTFLSGILGCLGAISIYYSFIFQGIVFFLMSGFCDMLDGYIARKIGKISDIGSILDILTDRFVEFLIILSIYLIDPIQNGIYCIFLLGSVLLCVTSFLVVGIFTENFSNKSFYYSPGLIERPEAFVFFILMFCFPKYMLPLVVLFITLITVTIVIRLYEFIKQSKE